MGNSNNAQARASVTPNMYFVGPRNVEEGNGTGKKVSPMGDKETIAEPKKSSIAPTGKRMSIFQLLYVLRPFLWPNAGSDGALKNRIRTVSTWIAVCSSKGCSLSAPFVLQLIL